MTDTILAAAQAVSIRGDVRANVTDHCRLAELAASRGAHVVVFPELSLTGYEPDLAAELAFTPADERLAPLQELADSCTTTLVVGAPLLLSSGLHIGALILQAGTPVKAYTKRHLHTGEERFFVPGTLDPRVDVGAESAAIAICADTHHPSHPAAAAESGASAYLAGVFFSPDGFPANADRLSGHASKHGMVVAMANSGAGTSRFEAAGNSSIWAPDGSCVGRLAGLGSGLVLARSTDDWIGEVVPD